VTFHDRLSRYRLQSWPKEEQENMGRRQRYLCEYCNVYLTHDSVSVRRAHNAGKIHLKNVVDYYQAIGNERAQSQIDRITSAYEQNSSTLPSNIPAVATGGQMTTFFGFQPITFPPPGPNFLPLPGLPIPGQLGANGLPPPPMTVPQNSIPPFLAAPQMSFQVQS